MPNLAEGDLTNYVAYGGTITFHSYYLLEHKEKLIKEFTKDLSQSLRHSQSSRYLLQITREYHKVQGQDDYESPHYHFILYSRFKIAISRVIGIQKLLREKYGRSQFMHYTKLKTLQWKEYIMKDVERLTKELGTQHYNETEIGPYCTCRQNKEYVYEQSEDFDIED